MMFCAVVGTLASFPAVQMWNILSGLASMMHHTNRSSMQLLIRCMLMERVGGVMCRLACQGDARVWWTSTLCRYFAWVCAHRYSDLEIKACVWRVASLEKSILCTFTLPSTPTFSQLKAVLLIVPFTRVCIHTVGLYRQWIAHKRSAGIFLT